MLERKHVRNGVWLCVMCYKRITNGRAMFCPPPELLEIIINAFTLNPSTTLREILGQPNAIPWLKFYLLVIPNIGAANMGELSVPHPEIYKFVDHIGFSNIGITEKDSTYLVYRTANGPATRKPVIWIDLAADEDRYRRLWFLPQIDAVNVVVVALWNLRLADTQASSHCGLMEQLARLHILLWQQKLDVLKLSRDLLVTMGTGKAHEENNENENISDNASNNADEDEMHDTSPRDQEPDIDDKMNEDKMDEEPREENDPEPPSSTRRTHGTPQLVCIQDDGRSPANIISTDAVSGSTTSVVGGDESSEQYMWGPMSTSNDKMVHLGGVPWVGLAPSTDEETALHIENRVRNELHTYGVEV
ncbi:hypothetical protein B0H16DRAFT_1561968 [Mycena metata]|uniref:Uncharacterized protein n=1 Tax=Mycena metata TaxID=1033252 RepID=A0AAD7N2U8_9AGAR|nr:hypothetical protein B0H16DRAFT_1561968 [Mycena metata]